MATQAATKRLPAEWEPHSATWLSWPTREGTSFYGDLEPIFPALHQFISVIAKEEDVYINIADEAARGEVLVGIPEALQSRVRFFDIATNEPWCRDHSPTFVINDGRLEAVTWVFNGWGVDWGDYSLDANAGELMANALNVPFKSSKLVCEGGALEYDGQGTLMVTASSLIDEKRNPGITKQSIESELVDQLGVCEIIWLTGGSLEGDDTSGHIDTFARFVRPGRVVASYQAGTHVTERILEELEDYRSPAGNRLEIVKLPIPPPLYVKGDRVPANYCNFYIANGVVVVPAFGVDEDLEAEQILKREFPDREIVMINSLDLIYGLGSFHCLSHQIPKVSQ